MKTQETRNTVLALLGLLALAVYIVACTSFSPDDSKVLYPAFDQDSGALGMAIYDRAARHSELQFVAPELKEDANPPKASYVRGGWLPDGRHIVVAYSLAQDNNEVVDFAVIPTGLARPIKLFHVSGLKDTGTEFFWPLCLTGQRVLISTGSKEVVRLDLNTGEVLRHKIEAVEKDITVLPAADGGAFYLESFQSPEDRMAFGRLDPETFARTALMNITNADSDKSAFAYDWDGKRIAFVQTNQLKVFRQSQPVFIRSLTAGRDQQLAFGSAGFSRKGDRIWATFQRKLEGETKASYGLMEIPLDPAVPVRETILIAKAAADKDPDATGFQGSLSHDGKAFAVDSTYLACKNEFGPEDCALFLVDLSSPNRRIIKVPIPVPSRHPNFK